MSQHHSYKATVKKLDKTGEVEIKSEISAAEFADAVKATLAHVRKETELPGFRKGTAPEKLVRERIGETALLKEAAEHAISHAYGHILEVEKIDAIGYPKVSITKIAEGNPLEFTIVTAIVPEIKNFDYKKISAKENAKKIEIAAVTDEEVEKAITDIKNNFARAKKQPKEGEKTEPIELTDELVKTWGDFKDVADFKKKLKDNLAAEKEHRALEKKRIELVDALTKELSIVIPEVLIESELGRMADQMKYDIERMGIKFDDYLKHLKKTIEDLRKEWRADAEKRVKLDLILDHVAKSEKISADKDKVAAEINHAKEHHKDIDPERARSYFEHIFLNQAVFEFLEKQK
ncbi:MAG TPA: trigger factor [Candidatus Paceibacterota bacterium]|nr:trigger factor [Candidatus Paceibacterota bacterium]